MVCIGGWEGLVAHQVAALSALLCGASSVNEFFGPVEHGIEHSTFRILLAFCVCLCLCVCARARVPGSSTV